MNALDRFFGIRAKGSTVPREIAGGLTTFATMSYIIFVQPTVLAAAGMPFGSVLAATCLSSAVACVLMGLVGRFPFALAPGMGENFLFAFTVVGVMGFSWQAGLAIVFISGVLFLALSLFSFREKVLNVLPETLKNAIGPAIGLFIAFVGMQWAGLVVLDNATMVGIGDFTQGPPLIALAGLLLIVTLLAWGFRGAILVGILCTAALGLLTGVIPLELAPEAWAGSQSLSFETFFALDFRPLLEHWREALLAIAIFFFLDLFDTVGTLVGVGMQAGYVDERGRMPGAGRAFFSDAAASCVGALFGTSTVTTYIESATGVAAGARTGLAPLVTAAGFLLALFFTPIIAIAGQDVAGPYYAAMGIEGGFVRMYPAVAPALIVVGFFMLAPLRRIQWDDITEAVPAFLTIAMMSFTFSISEGIAAGCVSYAAVKLTAGRAREVHPLMWLIAAALTAHYVFF